MRLLSSSTSITSLGLLLAACTEAATVTVNRGTEVANWEGWGTSLCWWANAYGDRDDFADAFFTLKNAVNIQGGPSNLPGLGMTIARYNIGGSSTRSINNSGKTESMKQSSNMPAFKFMESYWLDWFSSSPNSSSWNWNADAKQRTMLFKAKQRGVNQFEAFSNSPPWWMTNNHATAGGDNGGDNLQSWNYEQFAIYLATVVQHFRDSWGLTFQYVEPFNEPMGSWWKFPSNQEGCHVSRDVQAQILPYLRQHLNSRGLSNVAISASDENTFQDAYNTLSSLAGSSNAIGTFSKVNTHGYAANGKGAYTGPYRANLRNLARQRGKKVWNSEHGEDDATGIVMAESIARDIHELGATAFVYWQTVDIHGWGLVTSNIGDNWIQNWVSPKYFVFAQYSRHLRPGMTMLTTSDVKTVAAYDASRKVLVLVGVNTGGSSDTFTFDLSVLSSVGTTATVWVTETSDNGARYRSSGASVSGKRISVTLAAKSIVTIEIVNAVL